MEVRKTENKKESEAGKPAGEDGELCRNCMFHDESNKQHPCTYPLHIFADEYMFEGKDIIGCIHGRKSRDRR